jgi:hypothetical protein
MTFLSRPDQWIAMRHFAPQTFIVSIIDDGTKACYPKHQEQRNHRLNQRKALLS